MKTYYILGLIIALIPFLGFPNVWETGILFILGMVIFIKAFSAERLSKRGLSKVGDTFSQKAPVKKDERFELEDIVEEIEEELEEFVEEGSDARENK